MQPYLNEIHCNTNPRTQFHNYDVRNSTSSGLPFEEAAMKILDDLLFTYGLLLRPLRLKSFRNRLALTFKRMKWFGFDTQTDYDLCYKTF